MTESWSLSLVERGGVSGLLLVDDDLLEVAPVEGLGWLILARLRIGADTPASEVEAVEGALNRRVEAAGGRFVGHLRSSVELLSLSYVADAPGAEARQRLEAGWTSIEVRSDPGWSMALSTLTPTDRERQAGLDMLVMAELRHEGDDHARRRPVDHELSFPDGESAQAFDPARRSPLGERLGPGGGGRWARREAGRAMGPAKMQQNRTRTRDRAASSPVVAATSRRCLRPCG